MRTGLVWLGLCSVLAACGGTAQEGAELGVAGSVSNDAGTSGGGTGGYGTSGEAGGGTGGGGGSAPATFAAVQAIFADRCVNCHNESSEGPGVFGQLSLTYRDAYDSLVGKPAAETCGGTLVVPGDPANSYLWRKLNDDAPCEGTRMPRGGEAIRPTPLSADQLMSIWGWIAAGASP